ncbi:MAG: helix-turn-helix domain-containing protein [Clostridia bacterium]|nr:helix-turn-helix domain-containing protein [Clostridia bacterium]
MDSKTLGKRLREARLAKKMTQAEVVNGFITRNMLSLIESGEATPSMKTLEFLAERLELSLPVLMSEEGAADDLERLLIAKDAYKRGDYTAAIRFLEPPAEGDPLYDEACALLARAYGALGKEEQAAHYRSLGIYS